MLLSEEKKQALANQVIAKARVLLEEKGQLSKDEETGFVHKECHAGGFTLIEHQKQEIKGGSIHTNGLVVWKVDSGNPRKCLAVNYVPFDLQFFYLSSKNQWIDDFLNLTAQDSRTL